MEWPLAVAGGDADTLEIPLALSTPGGSVVIAGIPRDLDIVAGSARTYSPTIDADAFPGAFATRQQGFESGLVSGGFVSVNLLRQNGGGLEPIRKLRDTDGNPVKVQLRFRIAREDWGMIQDGADFSHLPGYAARPDTLSAPLYYYHEERGDWLLNDTFGWLEAVNGPVSPSILGQIQDGTFSHELYMVGLVDHFTFYNLDSPDSRACVTGRLLDQESQAVSDAGMTFYSPPGDLQYSFFSNIFKIQTSPTGHFKLAVPRTEQGPGDDWNRNNMVDNFRFFARYEDKDACGLTLFDNGGPGYPTPAVRSEDGCTNLGVLRVELRQAQRRTINVTFRDIVRPNQPDMPLFVSPPSMGGLNHAVSTLQDARVPVGGPIWQCVCDGTDLDKACNFQSTTNSDGRATFKIPVLDKDDTNPLNIVEFLTGTFTYRKLQPDFGVGGYEFAGCPYLVPENKTSEIMRCEVERRGPPTVEILDPAPTDTADGTPVYNYLFDDPVVLRAKGTDVNDNSIDHLSMFYWIGSQFGGSVLNGREHNSTAAAVFGVGNERKITVAGVDFYGWLGEASIADIAVEPVDIALIPDTLRLTHSQTDTILAVVTGANNKDVVWTSGNASVATVSPSGVVTASGVGETTIIGRSSIDPTKSATTIVTVLNVVARFTASPPLGDSTTVFTLDASESSGDITDFAWDFGDGNTGSGEVITHQFANSLDFQVTLIVTDPDGTSAHATQTVPASGGVLASFTATPQEGAPPLTVAFDGALSQSLGRTITSWLWEFDNGQTGSGETVSITYEVPGIYWPRLTVEDDLGRLGVDSLEIRINTLPVAEFTVEPDAGKLPLEVTVDANASFDPDGQIIRYGWDFGDGSAILNGSAIAMHTYHDSGNHVITLTTEDNDGRNRDSRSNSHCRLHCA